MSRPLPADLVDLVRPRDSGQLRHVERFPARPGVTAPWPEWTDPRLVAALADRGIALPWRHQVSAATAVHRGRHTVISTGTASGKTLAFQLPALTDVLAARRPNGRPGATVLYVAPTKALAQDQLQSLADLRLPRLGAVTHDGDSPPEQRDWARDHAEWLLTNPDMLHHSLLPGHARWARFLGQLRYIVVDECHHYRGVFGAHVALVLRRLRRICRAHGSDPTFVLASATVADPGVSAERLTGLPVDVVDRDDARRGQVSLALWEPPLTDLVGEQGAPVRRSASAETADLLADLVVGGVRTLAFVRSRRGAESVALTARRLLGEVDPALADTVAAYRSGYLADDRRALEQDLRSGRLTGVAATNALELGIDVAGLDAVILGGFPGTRAALWQQVGRAGRQGTDALAVMVARDDPLDTFLVNHPEVLVGAPVEATVFDPANPHVLGPHLCAAAAEAPLREVELPLFGAPEDVRHALDELVDQAWLRRRPAGWFWTRNERPSDLADLRSTGGRPVELVERHTGRVVGTVDAGSAHSTVHTGAVYLHQGETYVVDELDLHDGVATLSAAEPDYTTYARDLTDIRVVEEEKADRAGRDPACSLSFGTVQVTQRVVSFLRKAVPSGEVLGEEPLDLPPRVLETKAVWWTVAPELLVAAGLEDADLPGAAHAAEHAAIGILPLVAICDRWDIGGVSTALHPDTGRLTVFVYDGHPGGAGFAERGFETARGWLGATRQAIAACECEAGCPSCVQSPKCGNGNHPLNKQAAGRLLDVLLTGLGRTEGAARAVVGPPVTGAHGEGSTGPA